MPDIPWHPHVVLRNLAVVATWCDMVTKFARTFKRAAGSETSLHTEPAKRGRNCLQAPGNPLSISLHEAD